MAKLQSVFFANQRSHWHHWSWIATQETLKEAIQSTKRNHGRYHNVFYAFVAAFLSHESIQMVPVSAVLEDNIDSLRARSQSVLLFSCSP